MRKALVLPAVLVAAWAFIAVMTVKNEVTLWTMAKAQHKPEACAREEDEARPEHLKACECYQTKDPCTPGETTACKSWCDKSKCGCCQP